MEHKLIIVEFTNKFLVWLLNIFGANIEKGKELLPSHVVMAIVVTGIIITFFKITVKKPSLFPNKMQSFLEWFYKAFRSLIDDVIGEEGRKFIPAVATLGLFIGISNLMGLFPEMGSPTANLNVTAGCALFIFLYYHFQGIKKHGILGYLKTFVGPEWWLAPIFLPIEIISHLSRLLSLSMRLFGNIFGEDMVIIIIASYILSLIAPLPVMVLAIVTSLIQAFIFVMLSTL